MGNPALCFDVAGGVCRRDPNTPGSGCSGYRVVESRLLFWRRFGGIWSASTFRGSRPAATRRLGFQSPCSIGCRDMWPAEPLTGRKVLVMGLGVHGGGVGVARYLVRHGADVTVTDHAAPEMLESS